ncbi:MAG TPA: hypothetical protein VNN62_19140 [Methylomirabilota bacterium]|nr:hypothetical protein [Methylomirabilota bacterium]
MAERDNPAASEAKPHVTSDSFSGSQNQETGRSATFKALFWFLIVPIALLLLLKWWLQI